MLQKYKKSQNYQNNQDFSLKKTRIGGENVCFLVKSFVFEEKVLSLRHQNEITRINEYEKDLFIGITGGRNRCQKSE
jgi:hypothetical protein